MCRCAAAVARALVAFLDAVLVGCLLSCFRPRLRRGGSGSSSGSGRREQDAPVCRNRELTGGSIDREELRLEANYLKLCGAISETPAELQIQCDNMATNAPATNCALLLEANSSEGYEKEHHAASELSIEDTQHLPGVELVPHHPAFLENSSFQNIHHKLVDHSGPPFATPLVLRDDMQTPGTIYTSHRGASLSGKRVQTRKQFIYPILRPIENRLEQMELKEDSSPLLSFNPPKMTNLEANSVKKPKQTHSNSVIRSGLSKASSSSSCQVKEDYHQIQRDVENQGDVKDAAADQSHGECSFPTERPVLNASDLENPTPSLPKPWDGNGIPNTTTRYKEDQRVNWHTTPFEERLLKVLSDEGHRPPRKVVRGKLFHLEEKAV